MPCPYVRTVSRMPATTDFNTIVLLGVVVSGILNLKAIIFRNFAGWNFLDVFLFDFFLYNWRQYPQCSILFSVVAAVFFFSELLQHDSEGSRGDWSGEALENAPEAEERCVGDEDGSHNEHATWKSLRGAQLYLRRQLQICRRLQVTCCWLTYPMLDSCIGCAVDLKHPKLFF